MALVCSSIDSYFDSLHLGRLIDRQVSWSLPRVAEGKYGDTYLVVTPFIIYLKTSNAELGTQITTRKTDFLKPVERYKIVDLFGKSILTQEGQEWKRHRKIVGPSFSEKSNRLVFEESVRQAEGMMNLWAEKKGNTSGRMTVGNTAEDSATLSLHVICAAGFGVPTLWPNEGEEKLGGRGIPGFSDKTLSGRHELSFQEGLTHLLRYLIWFVIFPPWVLSKCHMMPPDSSLIVLQRNLLSKFINQRIRLSMNV